MRLNAELRSLVSRTRNPPVSPASSRQAGLRIEPQQILGPLEGARQRFSSRVPACVL